MLVFSQMKMITDSTVSPQLLSLVIGACKLAYCWAVPGPAPGQPEGPRAGLAA